MRDLETTVRQAMLNEEVQAINLFRTSDGGFQANIGYLESGAYKIMKHDDPVKALSMALAKRKKLAAVSNQFEDLLG